MTQLLLGLVFIGMVVIASQWQRHQKQAALQPIALQHRRLDHEIH